MNNHEILRAWGGVEGRRARKLITAVNLGRPKISPAAVAGFFGFRVFEDDLAKREVHAFALLAQPNELTYCTTLSLKESKVAIGSILGRAWASGVLAGCGGMDEPLVLLQDGIGEGTLGFISTSRTSPAEVFGRGFASTLFP